MNLTALNDLSGESLISPRFRKGTQEIINEAVFFTATVKIKGET